MATSFFDLCVLRGVRPMFVCLRVVPAQCKEAIFVANVFVFALTMKTSASGAGSAKESAAGRAPESAATTAGSAALNGTVGSTAASSATAGCTADPVPPPPQLSPEAERQAIVIHFQKQMNIFNLTEWARNREGWQAKFGTIILPAYPLGLTFWEGFRRELERWLATSKLL